MTGTLSGGAEEIRVEGPAERDSLFEIGSVTKVLTGLALADMVVRGEVALDDPLGRHLPAGETLPRLVREPTLEELATHRAGLPNTAKGFLPRELAVLLGLSRRDPWADRGRAEAALARTGARRTGRSRYSSIGYALLGSALAHRAGTTYEELVRERVLAPLGMDDTWIDVPEGLRDRLLTGFSRFGRPRPPIHGLEPASAFRSSAPDLLRLLAACLDPPSEAFALALRPRARIRGPLSVGLGWLILSRKRQPPVVWHNGATWGFRCVVGFVAGTGQAVVVLSNTWGRVERLALRMLEGRR